MVERKSIAGKASYRESKSEDRASIRGLQAAVYTNAVAGVSEALISGPADTLSLVAELDGEIVGHILLTPVNGPERALALAPHAILAAWRDMQIGTELVRHAIRLARERGWRCVFVFGQPDYYCRFGFKSHTADGAQIAWQGPRFLALELEADALRGWSGPLEYPEAYKAMASAIHK
ncbi:N-acetyltransferase [Hoeflea sp. AS60]|uniref:GNAT family N-acetyltransferase n=1 Tax=Hoeflea sp. AS60 TaxID=3135780 RepID=UPI00317E98D6